MSTVAQGTTKSIGPEHRCQVLEVRSTMAAQGVYNLGVNVSPEWQNPKYVGLLKGRTGVPVCLLYLRGISQTRFLELHSLEDVETEIQSHDNAWDKQAFRSCLPFFEAEGSSLHVAALPISGSAQTRLTEMLGQDRGLRQRFGIHVLKTYTEFADLVVVPQASQILCAEEHRIFYQRMMEEIGTLQHYFFLIDFPETFSMQDIEQHWQGFCFADSSAYTPWVSYKGIAYPPAMTVAALIQNNDQEHGISDLPANRPLKGNPMPQLTYHPKQLKELQDLRVNVIAHFASLSTRVWGGLTMADPCDADAKFISNRRSLLAVKEAVEEICAPFVMEPLKEDSLPTRVEANLTSLFTRVTKLFDPDAKTPFRFDVFVQEQGDEDVLVVDMKYFVPYALNEVSLTLGVNA